MVKKRGAKKKGENHPFALRGLCAEVIRQHQDPDSKGGNGQNHKQNLSRKTLRQQKKQEKKTKKRNHSTLRGPSAESEEDSDGDFNAVLARYGGAASSSATPERNKTEKKASPQTPSAKRQDAKPKDAKKASSLNASPSTKTVSKNKPSALARLAGDVADHDEDDGPTLTSELFTGEEEQELRYLEKQLGIDSKDEKSLRKLQAELEEDGMDDLFGFCDHIAQVCGGSSAGGKKSSLLPKKDKYDVGEEAFSEDEEEEEFSEPDEPIDLEAVMRERGHLLEEDLEAAMRERGHLLEEGEDSDAEEIVDDDEDEKEIDSEDEEDMEDPGPAPPAKKRKTEASSVTSKPGAPAAGAYVPPHLRKKTENNLNEDLRNQLRGLCNKLSEGNLDGVATEICNVLLKMQERSVSEGCGDVDSPEHFFASVVVDAATEPPINVLVVACYAALLLASGAVVDKIFFEACLDKLEKQFLAFCVLGEKGTTSDELVSEAAGRAKNCSILLSLLFHFEALPAQVPFNMFKRLFEKHQNISSDRINYGLECALDLALTTLRYAGQSLRARHPTDFNDIVKYLLGLPMIKELASEKISNTSSRLHFLAAELRDLQGGKGGGFAVIQRLVPTQTWVETCELLKSCRKKGVAAALDGVLSHNFLFEEPVLCSGANSSSTKGTVHAAQKAGLNKTSLDGESGDGLVDDQKALLEQAKSQHMSTESKRSIFVVLQGAADETHAARRLAELKIPGRIFFPGSSTNVGLIKCSESHDSPSFET